MSERRVYIQNYNSKEYCKIRHILGSLLDSLKLCIFFYIKFDSCPLLFSNATPYVLGNGQLYIKRKKDKLISVYILIKKVGERENIYVNKCVDDIDTTPWGKQQEESSKALTS